MLITFIPATTATPAYALAKGDFILTYCDYFIELQVIVNIAQGADGVLIDTRSTTIYKDGVFHQARFTHDCSDQVLFDAIQGNALGTA